MKTIRCTHFAVWPTFNHKLMVHVMRTDLDKKDFCVMAANVFYGKSFLNVSVGKLTDQRSFSLKLVSKRKGAGR